MTTASFVQYLGDRLVWRLVPDYFVLGAITLAAMAALLLYGLRGKLRLGPAGLPFAASAALLGCVAAYGTRYPLHESAFIPRYCVLSIPMSLVAIAVATALYRLPKLLLIVAAAVGIGWNLSNSRGQYFRREVDFHATLVGSNRWPPALGDFSELGTLWIESQDALLEIGRVLDGYSPEEIVVVSDFLLAHAFALPEMGYVRQRFDGYTVEQASAFIPHLRDLAEVPESLGVRRLIAITSRDDGLAEEVIYYDRPSMLRVLEISDPERIADYLRPLRDKALSGRFFMASQYYAQGKTDVAYLAVEFLSRRDASVREDALKKLIEADGLAMSNTAAADTAYRQVLHDCPALARYHAKLRELAAETASEP